MSAWCLTHKQRPKVTGLTVTVRENIKHIYIYIYILRFLSDKGPMLETLDYTIRIGSTPTILYFDLYIYIYNKFENMSRVLNTEVERNSKTKGQTWITSFEL